MAIIFPSLIGAPLLNLEATIQILEPHCAGFHLDIMDFHHVPNLTWGPDFINAIRKFSEKQLWVHLMVENPEGIIERLELCPNDLISLPYEHLSNTKTKRFIEILHRKQIKVGLALKPKMPIELIKHFDHIIDHVLLMSVEPGFSGQVLLPDTYQRLQTLYDLREEHSLSFRIALDGGINEENLPRLVKGGGDIFAVAAGIFSAPDPVQALERLNKIEVSA